MAFEEKFLSGTLNKKGDFFSRKIFDFAAKLPEVNLDLEKRFQGVLGVLGGVLGSLAEFWKFVVIFNFWKFQKCKNWVGSLKQQLLSHFLEEENMLHCSWKLKFRAFCGCAYHFHATLLYRVIEDHRWFFLKKSTPFSRKKKVDRPCISQCSPFAQS